MSYIIRWLWDGIYWIFQQIYNVLWGCINQVITWFLNVFFTLLDYIVYFLSLIILCFYYVVDWVLVSSLSFLRQFSGDSGIFGSLANRIFGQNAWANINAYIDTSIFNRLGLFFDMARLRQNVLFFIGFLLAYLVYRFIARWVRG